jgi:hypothetical protein
LLKDPKTAQAESRRLATASGMGDVTGMGADVIERRIQLQQEKKDKRLSRHKEKPHKNLQT